MRLLNHLFKSFVTYICILIYKTLWLQGTVELSERVNETIKYIESLKANIEKLMKNKKGINGASTSRSIGIQIHEMSPDVDLVLFTGLKNQSTFYDVIRVLNHCGTDVMQANFSACGPSTFHVNHKKVSSLYINFVVIIMKQLEFQSSYTIFGRKFIDH